jgi:motility quorum-sensing regulator / GCU-specific mRNA interferase toxin
MEKRTPHCKLTLIHALIQQGKVRATTTAFAGARELDIEGMTGICAVVLSLATKNFYKSMTTYADHRIWQDVYHTTVTNGKEVYLKLTVIDDVLVVSFKEL